MSDSSATILGSDNGNTTAGEISVFCCVGPESRCVGPENGEPLCPCRMKRIEMIKVWQDLENGTYVLKGVYGGTEIHLSPEEAQKLYRELYEYFAPVSLPPLDQDHE